MKTIAIFNPVGGAGRTTTALYVALTWAAAGDRVVLIDADPCRSVTRQLLDADISAQLQTEDRLHLGIEVPGRRGLLLVAVPPDLLQAESGHQAPIEGHAPRPSVIPELLRAHSFITTVATTYRADFVVIDLGPNLGALNRSLVLSSHGLLVPMHAHYLCRMGLDSLISKLPEWIDGRTSVTPALPASPGQVALPVVRLLGTIIRRNQSRAQLQLAAELSRHAADQFIPAMATKHATFSLVAYRAAGIVAQNGYRIAEIDDFRDLMDISRTAGRPIS